ncbi:MAG: ABC transporter permease [Candidatus Thorarchaeota archaeon]
MSRTKLVSGIFFQLTPTKETFEGRSGKWWFALLALVGIALSYISTMILIAVGSNSGIGLQVVAGTFIIGLLMLFGSAWRRQVIEQEIMTKRRAFTWFIGFCIIITIVVSAAAFFFLPAAALDLGFALVSGGFTIGAACILLYDFYPMLKERGNPGLAVTGGLLIVLSIVYMTFISYWIVPHDPFTLDIGLPLAPPSSRTPLGTTELGQDLLSRTIAGGAIMLQVAVVSVIVCFFLGVPTGLAAAYKGGMVDRVVSLVMDSIFAFPGLVLAIAIAAMLGPGVVNMAISIAVVYVPSYYRVIRSQVLSIKELPYVEAAVVMGARNWEILFKYILPNALPSAVVVLSINFADAILTAAGLTFVGLGFPIDIADWGYDLTAGWGVLIIGKWWLMVFPGIMIVLLALGFTLAGEGLSEILTPKLRE